jgi:toxin ParE1/3/4
MKRINVSDRARHDLDAIWSTVAADNLRAADRLTHKITAQYAKLCRFPGMGSQRDELRPELRSWPVGNYLIFYKIVDDGIEIIRVLHGARDIPKLFNQP